MRVGKIGRGIQISRWQLLLVCDDFDLASQEKAFKLKMWEYRLHGLCLNKKKLTGVNGVTVLS